jgi:hypothetical protein
MACRLAAGAVRDENTGGSMSDKTAYDTDCDANKTAMERFFRALVTVRGHFTDSFSLAPVDKPTRGVSVFFRVWLRPGTERRFCDLAGAEIKPPGRVSVGTDGPPDDESRCAVCGWGLVADEKDDCVRGNCSMRPRPPRLYAPERAKKEGSCV